MNLNFKEQMQIIAKRKNIKIADICDELNTTRQNLNQKLNRDNLTRKDMQKIADILSCDLIIELREKGGDVK